jgi:hypothetical protein
MSFLVNFARNYLFSEEKSCKKCGFSKIKIVFLPAKDFTTFAKV